MFGREKTKTTTAKVAPVAATPVSKIETIIGPNAHFRGDIQSDGGMRIDGILEGNLDVAGNLVIGESAKIIAEITANNISISGAVKGNITGNRVEILETGRVWGDLTINSLLLNEGAWWSNAGDGAGFQWSVFDNDYAMMTTKTEYSLHRQNAS